MEAFLAVVRHGGFSAAARQIGIAPSVVADRVSGLERRLGVRLLNRTTRRQTLTEPGIVYAEQAGTILASIAEMEARVAEEASSLAGALRVTAPMPIGRQRIAPFAGAFVDRYPDIRIHLTLDNRYADLIADGCDIAIRGGHRIDSSLTGRRLFETRRVVVASPAYLERRGAPANPQDLGAHACLAFNSGSHFQAEWRFGKGDAARNLRITGALVSTDSELPVAWALAGLGVAQKSWWEVAHHVRSGDLVTVLDAHEPDPISMFAIYPIGRAQSRKITTFVDELIVALKDFAV